MFPATNLPRIALSFLALLAVPATARAGAVLTLDSTSIIGAPGELFTISGSITNSSATLTEAFNSLNPSIFSSPVLLIDAVLAPSSLAVDQVFTGNIVRFQIAPGAIAGLYPTNSFALSYGTGNGRTFNSNAINLSVQVTGITPPPIDTVPEPATLWITGAGLTLLIWLRRRQIV